MNESDKRIRVLVVDDSAFMRKVLHSIISADPQLVVVGQARDGREALALAQSLKPDVITMDIKMPHVDGLQATELIMTGHPRPIVIVSSESREGAASTLQALELGAIDFVAKPSGGVNLDMDSVRDELISKLKMAAKVRVVRTATRSRIIRESGGTVQRIETPRPGSMVSGRAGAGTTLSGTLSPTKGSERFPIVVVAASTGGPATLMRFIPSFPRDFSAAVILIQHMPANFTAQFGRQLAESSAIRVKEAEPNEYIRPATAYICPGSHHLRVSPLGRITLDGGARISGYRPCADITLETVAAYAGPLTLGVVLTGMGNDAACGVRAVKAAGGYVIAQDETTAVIFGMPAEAIKTGAVDKVLALEEIYPAIEKRLLDVFSAPKVTAP